LLPNGAMLAVCLCGVLSSPYRCAPLNPNATAEEIYLDLLQLKAKACLTHEDGDVVAEAATRANIPVILIKPHATITGLFDFCDIDDIISTAPLSSSPLQLS